MNHTDIVKMKHFVVHITVVVLVTLLVLQCANGQSFNPAPLNTVAIVGEESAQLDCTIQDVGDDITVWQELITDPESPSGISTDGDVRVDPSKYEIVETYNLRVLNPVTDDAGTYQCTKFSAPVIEARAELIVLESAPEHTTNISGDIAIEGEYIHYTCEVGYKGKWAPRITWKDEQNDPVSSISLGINGSSVKEQIVLEATLDISGKSYTCTTDFGELDPAPGEDEANNIPSYRDVHSFGTITVHYPPRNTQIEPDDASIHVGEELRCTASSLPEVDAWEWKNLTDPEEGVISTESTLLVEESWLGDVVNISCTVFNTMRDGTVGQDTTSVSFTAYQTTTTTTTTVTTTTTESTTSTTTDKPAKDKSEDPGVATAVIVGVVVPLVIVVVVVIVVLFCCMRKKAKRKEAEASRPPKSAMQNADLVRRPTDSQPNNSYMGPSAPISTIGGPPPPYNGDTSYDSGYDPYGTDPRKRNVENIVYADLALDDTPRSRKPIQVYEQTDYAELQRV